MRQTPQWSEVKERARRLAARGRTEWRRTRARLERLATAPREPPALPPEPTAGGAVAAAAHPGLSRRFLNWGLGIMIALIVVVGLIIAFWDWDRFRGPIANYASAQTHRAVRIDGHLHVHLLTWTPEVTITGLKIGNPAWAGKGDTAVVDRLRFKVKLVPLLGGHVEMPLLEITRPDLHLIKDVRGRANWKLQPDTDETPTKLPPIQHLVVNDGHIDLVDLKRRLHLIGVVQTSEDVPGSGRGEFRLRGRGALNGHPFELQLSGGPLIDVRKDRPYQFVADMRSGATHIAATGSIAHPFDLGVYQARLTASGDDLGKLYDITALTFPETPPYAVTGQFSRDQSTYRFSHFAGRVGNSDLAGDVTVSKPKDRRLLKADLVSRSLDWADLATVLGGAPTARKGGPSSPEQKAVAQKMTAEGRILPDAKLSTERIRAMDADVHFRATAVKANRMRLSQVRLGVRLDHGVLTVNPLAFGFAHGDLDGNVRIDARAAAPKTDIDLALKGYGLELLVPLRGGAPPVTGLVNGRAKLHGSGLSVRETASNASGSVSLTSANGEIRQAFAELLGINVGRGLSLLLNKDPHKTTLRCAAADFDVSGGVMRTRRLVIDTGVVVSNGSGTVDLRNERLNLKLQGKSKQPRLLRLWAPITLTGTLLHPKPGVDTQSVVTQGGVAAGLGALINPLAAILPFITPGGAKDVDCAALTGQAVAPRAVAAH